MMRPILLVLSVLSAICPIIAIPHTTIHQSNTRRGQPIQLIYPDANHRRLLLNETSLSMIASINTDLAIISSTGPLHSGKSFLLNQLIGVQHGFTLGSTVDPMTRGLWAWSEPVDPHINRRAHHSSNQPAKHVLFLDTEGFAGDANALYDSKVFGVASLLSSVLMYNSVRMIDQSSIDSVEMLARQTQLFAHRAQAQYEKNHRKCTTKQPSHRSTNQSVDQCIHDSKLQFPSLVWIAQDFTQDLMGQSADDWLMSLLSRPHHRETHVVSDDRARASITDVFASVHCRTMFLPHTNRASLQHLDKVPENQLTPEYLQDLQALRELVFTDALLTSKGTGKYVVHLLRWLVEMVNLQNELGVFPEAPSSWAAFVELQSVLAVDSSYGRYRDTLDDLLTIDRKQVSRLSTPADTMIDDIAETLPPPSVYPASMTLSEQIDDEPSPAEFKSLKKSSEIDALDSLRDMLTGWDTAYRKSAAQLKSRISTINEAYDKHYEQRVDRLLRQAIREQVKAYAQEMDDWHVAHPIVPNAPALAHHQNTLTAIVEHFEISTIKFTDLPRRAEEIVKLAAECERIGRKHLNEAADRVNAHLTSTLTQVVNAASNAFKPHKPLNDEDIKTLIDSLTRVHLTSFKQHIDPALYEEKAYHEAVKILENQLHELSSSLLSKNAQLVLHACKHAMRKASDSAERLINGLHLPMAEQSMQEETDELISTVVNEQFRPANEELYRLRDTAACQHEITATSKVIASAIEDRNVNALNAVFTTPLAVAAKRMRSVADTYWLPFTFRRDAARVAVAELHQHVEKVSEYAHLDLHGSLVSKMIDKFIERDLHTDVDRLTSMCQRLAFVVVATMLAIITGTLHLRKKLRKGVNPKPVPPITNNSITSR